MINLVCVFLVYAVDYATHVQQASRRSIAHVLKIVWPNKNHRDAVDREAKYNDAAPSRNKLADLFIETWTNLSDLPTS